MILKKRGEGKLQQAIHRHLISSIQDDQFDVKITDPKHVIIK
jgi:hypothetical protein